MSNFKLGRDLVLGDVLDKCRRYGPVVQIEPYVGPLEYLWPQGALIVRFAAWQIGMTVDCQDTFWMATTAAAAHGG